MKHSWAALLCFFLFISGSLRAQGLHSYRLRQIQDAMQEKMHLPANSPAVPFKGEETPQAMGETKISTTYPESEVHAAINPTDTTNIVVGPIHLSNGMALPIYYTTNFGQNWKKSSFLPTPYEAGATVVGGGDPVFAYDAAGKVYMTWMDWYYKPSNFDTLFAGIYWASSSNGGATWERPASKSYIAYATEEQLNGWANGLDDKEWIAVDRSNSPHRNTLYVAWTHLGDSNYGIIVRRKLPGVDTMEPEVHVTNKQFLGVQYTSLGVDANGGLHVTFMGTLDTINYGIYQVYSSDGGKSFQPPVKISDADIPGQSADTRENGDVIFGIRPNGNYPCPHLSIDTAVTGNLYEVWNALGTTADELHGADIYFSRSTDNGATWSPATIINNDLDTENGNYIDHFYPSVAVDGKGKISVTWYDRREDPYNQIGRYYIAQSTDQGHSWTNAPVATQPMDFNYVMNINGNFGIGEYTQVLSTPNYTIPVWTDGRDGTGNLRVYAAFIAAGSAAIERFSTVSQGIQLSRNYPNPFAASTNLRFTLATPAHARLFVTNIAGQQVASIFDGMAATGEHDFSFDGSQLANGVYYLNLETDLGIARNAMTILR